MSKLADILAARAVEVLTARKERDTEPVIQAGLKTLEAGWRVAPKDRTPAERENARKRRNERRATRAKVVAQQVAAATTDLDAIETDDAAQYNEQRYMTASASLARWYPTIRRISFQHFKRIERYLGSDRDTGSSFGHLDVAQELFLLLCRQVARSDMSLTKVGRAVTWLNENYGGIPLAVPASQPEAQWLVTRARFNARFIIRTFYRANPTLLSIQALDTAYANTGGVDQFISAVKANHAPSMSGYRFADPGKPDPFPLAVMIDAEIERRGLGPVVDLLTSDSRLSDGRLKYRRNDGSFRWTTYGRKMLGLLGEYVHPDLSKQIVRMQAIRKTRAAFEWLPELVGDLVDKGFEGGLPHGDREWGIVIQFIDADAAAKAIKEHATEILEVLTS